MGFRGYKKVRTEGMPAEDLCTSSGPHLVLCNIQVAIHIAMSKVIIVLVTLVSLSCGCLITNCPRGGKRGGPTFLLENLARECPACGHEEQGRCFGPHICCSPSMGCLIGTPETLHCRKESLYSRPCVAGFAMCQGNSGRCAANGICCSQESCFIDSACKLVDETGNDRKIGAEFGAFLLENTGTNEHIL